MEGAQTVLPGGYVTDVVRIGDTVRRRPGPRAAYVREVLRHFERHAWPGAPRLLGTDERGREVLTFLEGHVAWEPVQPAEVRSEASLARVAELVRQFHDLTAGTPLAQGAEVVCHNDLAPRNTVYRDLGTGLRPVGFIDWDLAAPGARLHDVAHVCWQYLSLGPGAGEALEAARSMRLLCDAYGLADRAPLVETILWWQDRCWRGIEAGADAGEPAMQRLRDCGAAREVREAYQWVAAQRSVLEGALR
ncbi:MAG TPA: phosphotransferase [Chloroflexota bacterium]|nr:phosphotransferase [Chloroflexota bacterium]